MNYTVEAMQISLYVSIRGPGEPDALAGPVRLCKDPSPQVGA